MTNDFKDLVPGAFNAPEQLPDSEAQASEWQHANRTFWESNPMRYDWNDGVEHEEFSRPFFDEIDKRFFGAVWLFMPWKKLPFEQLMRFDTLGDKDVLEIGTGMGSHAQLLATHARSYTGIDLTDYAIKAATARLAGIGVSANVQRMDAEQMSFPDASFDFVWSWGVIHHSSNTRRILEQMRRVLRPGGRATVMVYYRSWWHYYTCQGFIKGLLSGSLLKTGSIARSAQYATDGAIARYYSFDGFRKVTDGLFRVTKFSVTGEKPHLVPLPAGGFKNFVLKLIPGPITRFLLGPCRMGGFLIAELERLD